MIVEGGFTNARFMFCFSNVTARPTNLDQASFLITNLHEHREHTSLQAHLPSCECHFVFDFHQDRRLHLSQANLAAFEIAITTYRVHKSVKAFEPRRVRDTPISALH